jgi:hypothetical protein
MRLSLLLLALPASSVAPSRGSPRTRRKRVRTVAFSAAIVAAATNGTQRTYTESLLKTVLQSIWVAGGNPKMVITNGTQKQAEAAFVGLADQRRETGDKQITIVAGADVYVSDFGRHRVCGRSLCVELAMR